MRWSQQKESGNLDSQIQAEPNEMVSLTDVLELVIGPEEVLDVILVQYSICHHQMEEIKSKRLKPLLEIN